MKVAILGPGRLGTALALALPRAGHRVVAVVGGSPASRERFADRVAGVRHRSLADACAAAELVLLAVPDGAVVDVVREMARDDLVGPGHRVVHLAGALGLEVLRPAGLAGAGVAALHPAQSITGSAGAQELVGAAWAVTTGPNDRDWARELVADLGGDAHDVRDEDRELYHAGLVLGSNAVGAAVAVARQLLLAARVPDPTPFLTPLVARSIENVLGHGVGALTGPVVRGDDATLARHLTALDDDVPELAAAYRHLQRAVLAMVSTSLDPDAVRRLTRALGGESGSA